MDLRPRISSKVVVPSVAIALILGVAIAALPATASDPCLFVTVGDPEGQLRVVTIDTADAERREFGIKGLPSAIVPSSDGRFIYGAFTELSDIGCPAASRLEVIEADTGKSLRQILLAEPGAAVAIEISPDGRRLFVADNVASRLFVVDTTTETVEHALPLENAGGNCPPSSDLLPAQPIGLAMSTDGRWLAATTAYCGSVCRFSVSLLDTTTHEIIRTISASGMHAAFSPDSTKLFVTHRVLASILVVANPSGEHADEISLRAHELTAGPDVLYAPSTNGIVVIDPVTNELLRTIDVRVGEMETEAEQLRGYATTSDGIVVIDLVSDSVIEKFQLSDPLGVVVGTCPPTVGCFGDCDIGGTVTVDELVVVLGVALGQSSGGSCPFIDAVVGDITVAHVVAAVNNALRGCHPGA